MLIPVFGLLMACRHGVAESDTDDDLIDVGDDTSAPPPGVPCPVPTRPEATGPWVAVDAGAGTCGIRADGTLACAQAAYWEESPFGDMRVVKVSVGAGSVCVLSDEGLAHCTGLVTEEGTPPAEPMCDISASNTWACGILAADGALTCWGVGNPGTMYESSEPTNPANLPRGSFRALDVEHVSGWALDADGHPHGWADMAYPDEYDAPVPEGAAFSTVSAGDGSCGVTIEGELLCWGDIRMQRVPKGDDFAAVSMRNGTGGDGCAMRINGELACWNDYSGSFPVPYPSELFASIALGIGHGCGLTPLGEIQCWGDSSPVPE